MTNSPTRQFPLPVTPLYSHTLLPKPTPSRETGAFRKLSSPYCPSHGPCQTPNDIYGAIRVAEGHFAPKMAKKALLPRMVGQANRRICARRVYARHILSPYAVETHQHVAHRSSARSSTDGWAVMVQYDINSLSSALSESGKCVRVRVECSSVSPRRASRALRCAVLLW